MANVQGHRGDWLSTVAWWKATGPVRNLEEYVTVQQHLLTEFCEVTDVSRRVPLARVKTSLPGDHETNPLYYIILYN